MQQRFSLFLRLFICCCCLSLTSCALFPHQRSATPSHAPEISANDYLQRAGTEQGPQRQADQLNAVATLLQNHQNPAAKKLLAQINAATLPTPLRTQYTLLQARLMLASHHPSSALQQLNMLQPIDQLSTQQQQIWHRLMAKAYHQNHQTIASLQQHLQLNALLQTPQARYQNQLDSWDTLLALSDQQLSALLQRATDPNVRGWLQLALIAKQHYPSSAQLVGALQQWRSQYPQHPANTILPQTLNAQNTVFPAQPSHIALLLPLNGPLGRSGQAVRNGFLTAYYAANQQHKTTATVQIINTASNDVVAAYQQALQQGADIIVGPLTKNNEQRLVNHYGALPIPTLALNTLTQSSDQPITNLYQFGLSPRDEARQVATVAHQEGHSQALLIAPEGSWGHRIVQAFQQRWQQLGGRVVGSTAYPFQHAQFADPISALLDIKQSKQRATALKRLLHKSFRFVPERRQDVDMIFVVAPPHQARQIRPLLNYYFAGNIPVYGLSLSYSGHRSARHDRNLNGMIFSDMPWVLDSTQQLPPALARLRARTKTSWPHSYARHARLYALGIDAYNLLAALNQMNILPNYRMNGATGHLYLKANHHIQRQLLWAQIQHGVPKKVIR